MKLLEKMELELKQNFFRMEITLYESIHVIMQLLNRNICAI